MKTRLRRSLPALVVAGALVLSGCEFEGAYDLPLPGSPVDEDDAYQVTAEFADVLNVVPRSVVMVDDVTVGEVTEVDRLGWHAKVTMLVRKDVELPDNAVADIRQVSLLGEKYVALEEPIGEEPVGRLGDGDDIPLSSTGRNPEVEEVLGALSFLLNGGGVGQLGTITQELNNVMSGRTGRVRHLLGSLESVIGTLDQQKTQIIAAMESMNDLASTLNAERETIGDALDVMGPAVSVLADQHQELVQMLGALRRLGNVGARVIGASKEDLIDDAGAPAAGPHQAQRCREEPGSRAGHDDQLPVPPGGRERGEGRLRQRLDPGRHQPRDLPARRGGGGGGRTDPAAGPRAGAGRGREVSREPATRTVPPARRCSTARDFSDSLSRNARTSTRTTRSVGTCRRCPATVATTLTAPRSRRSRSAASTPT